MMPKKFCHCGKPSLPGLISGAALCRYHFNVKMYGREWADHCEANREATKEGN